MPASVLGVASNEQPFCGKTKAVFMILRWDHQSWSHLLLEKLRFIVACPAAAATESKITISECVSVWSHQCGIPSHVCLADGDTFDKLLADELERSTVWINSWPVLSQAPATAATATAAWHRSYDDENDDDDDEDDIIDPIEPLISARSSERRAQVLDIWQPTLQLCHAQTPPFDLLSSWRRTTSRTYIKPHIFTCQDAVDLNLCFSR